MKTRKYNTQPVNNSRPPVPATPENTLVELKDGTVVTMAMYIAMLTENK